MSKTTKNPQDWLPIGQMVAVPKGTMVPRESQIAEIVEHLNGGGVAVKFAGYQATWDYTAREAARFTRLA